MTYPYPGDDPAALDGLSVSLDSANVCMTTFNSSLNEVKGQLSGAWTGEVADKASTDLVKIGKAVPDIAKRLNDGKTAVDTYRTVIVAVRKEIDDLRTQHDKLASNLDDEQTTYSRSGSFGEANDMSTDELNTYRTGIISKEKKDQNAISALDNQYEAQVKKSNTAAENCRSALKTSYSTTAYKGSYLTTTGITSVLGLDNLQASHWAKMVQDAKNFEKESKNINDSNLSPEERNAKIQALVKKYGQEASDPDFATTVAKDKGQNYFKQFLVQTGAYDTKHAVDPALEKQLLGLNATILATATDQTNPVHVDQKWIKDFFSDGQGGVNPDAVMAGSDYTRLGVRFPTAFLDGVGQSALQFEADHTPNNLDANGRLNPPWRDHESDLFYPGGEPFGTDFHSNDDPLTSVMQQFADHPDANSTLFSDHGSGGQDLYALTHRAWGDGGAKALGDAVYAETGPNAGNIKTSAGIASEYIHDVVQNPQSEPGYAGVPSELHDSVANVISRYMGDVIAPEGSGLPGSGGQTQISGFDEGAIAHANFDKGDLSQAMKFAMSDTHDHTGRDALASAWSRVSANDMGLAYHGVQGSQDHDPSLVFNTGAASAKALGLITQSDISGYDDAHAAEVEQAELRKKALETLESLIPIPELPEGTPAAVGTVYDAGIDTVKDMVNDALVPTPADHTAEHADDVTAAALTQIDRMPPSIITHLSHLGIPIVFDNGHATATVPYTDATNGFVDPTTHHLLPYSEIAKNPVTLGQFNQWYQSHGYGQGDLPQATVQSTIHDAYDEGTQEAAH
ncbi:MAG: hypothetical protein ACR2KJ_08230 [Jatrophihabitans sp.]